MAQHDYNIANATFPNTRTDINNALSAVASNNSGTAAPSTTFANQWFYETDTNLLQIRNEDNDAYITIAELDQTNDTVEYFKADSIRTALIEFTDGDDAITIADGGVVTIGAAGTVTTVAGITFYVGQSGSIYTADVSGTDNSAENNTAFGTAAMDAITTGDNNVAMGEASLGALTTGADNVAIGYNAGSAGTSASYSTMVGRNAGAANTGNSLTAIGYYAGSANTSATQNTFLGFNAGAGCTDGGFNTAMGHNALRQPDSETNNVAIGRLALEGAIAGGEYNVAVGNNTLDALTSGDYNTAVGYNAGTGLTTGSSNVLVGPSIEGTITGDDNTCVGEQAGKILAGGGSNTCIGSTAGVELTSGSNNTFVGHDAGRTGSPGGSIGTGSNNLHLGDENVSSCQIQTDWTVASDERDKTDFTALDIGLDFVNSLRPYTYKWDKRIKYVSEEDRDSINLDTITHDGTHKEDWLDIGFKAQEVEVLEKAAGYKIADKTNLTTSLTEDGKQYGIKYSNFVPILVKAVQELSAKVKALEEA